MSAGIRFVGLGLLFVVHRCHGAGDLGTVMVLVELRWKSWIRLVHVVGYQEDRWALMRIWYGLTGVAGPQCESGTVLLGLMALRFDVVVRGARRFCWVDSLHLT